MYAGRETVNIFPILLFIAIIAAAIVAIVFAVKKKSKDGISDRVCPNCGQRIVENGNYCRYCGARIDASMHK